MQNAKCLLYHDLITHNHANAGIAEDFVIGIFVILVYFGPTLNKKRMHLNMQNSLAPTVNQGRSCTLVSLAMRHWDTKSPRLPTIFFFSSLHKVYESRSIWFPINPPNIIPFRVRLHILVSDRRCHDSNDTETGLRYNLC